MTLIALSITEYLNQSNMSDIDTKSVATSSPFSGVRFQPKNALVNMYQMTNENKKTVDSREYSFFSISPTPNQPKTPRGLDCPWPDVAIELPREGWPMPDVDINMVDADFNKSSCNRKLNEYALVSAIPVIRGDFHESKLRICCKCGGVVNIAMLIFFTVESEQRDSVFLRINFHFQPFLKRDVTQIKIVQVTVFCVDLWLSIEINTE